jgi:hypothetical protein
VFNSSSFEFGLQKAGKKKKEKRKKKKEKSKE